jgi:hypothetical protein
MPGTMRLNVDDLLRFEEHRAPPALQKPQKGREIHHQDAENLDETSDEGSNHPKLHGTPRSSPSTPTIPRRPVTRGRAGLRSL